MGLLISNRPSALNEALCMPFAVLYLFTMRSLFIFPARMYVPQDRSLAQKSSTRGTIWKAWQSGVLQNLVNRKILGVMRAEQSEPQTPIAPRSRSTGICLLNIHRSLRVDMAGEGTVENNDSCRCPIPCLPSSPSPIVLRSLPVPGQKLLVRNLDA